MKPVRLEFHCHTIYSKDSLTKIPELLRVAEVNGIDKLVITDHNTIAGAQAAHDIDPQRVIIGEEIYTQQGELLAAFVKEEIPKGLSAKETIARLKDQDA
ncbi:MAG: PHP domain-containing protein, partial [Chloroflexota bacterium]